MVQEKMRKHIQQMVSTNPMIGQLNEQFTSWLLGSGLTGIEIANTIDSNKDAVIQPHELAAALKQTTGTEPPGWVINGLLTLLDSDNDKTVTVGDLFTYFEQIGLPLGVPDPAEQEAARKAAEQEAARKAAEQEAARKAAEQEAARKAAEQEAARKAAEQEAARKAAEQEAARKAAEQKLEASMEEIDMELEDVSTPESVDDVPEESKVGGQASPSSSNPSEHNHLQIIEALNSMKLSSQIREAVKNTSMNHHFSVKIEKIESTLMGHDSFKNGKTIVGRLVDEDSVEIELLFQAVENESVNNFQANHIIEIDAHIANWNIGRKRAVFSVHSYNYD
jgi:hypothetical protein